MHKYTNTSQFGGPISSRNMSILVFKHFKECIFFSQGKYASLLELQNSSEMFIKDFAVLMLLGFCNIQTDSSLLALINAL